MTREFCIWRAVDAKGKLCRGTWNISEVTLARSLLFKQGYYPLSIRVRRRFSLWALHRDYRGIWSNFLRKLAALLDSGIPLLSALEIIILQEKRAGDKQGWQMLRDTVAAGNDLSEAIMKIHPAPPSFVRIMIKAGERTGDLAHTLESLVDELEQELYFTRKMKAALAYPLILALAVVGVLYVLSGWVLPIYEKLFADLGSDLPAVTRIIFFFGHSLPTFLWCLSGLMSMIFLWLRFIYKENWREKLEQWSQRLPALGRIFRLKEIQQFSRVMGMLLKAGIVFDDSLMLAQGVAVSAGMKELVKNLLEGIHQGRRLAPVFRSNISFPVVAREMLSIAEETGKWDKMFWHLAGMYKVELEELTEKIARLIEPLTITFIAGLIGLTAIGVLLPVFDAGTLMQ